MPSSSEKQRFTFDSMGCQWAVTVWDSIDADTFVTYTEEAVRICKTFEQLYSRFRADSLVRQLAQAAGTAQVPTDLVSMLRICEQFNQCSDGAFNPLVGSTLEDIGYDEQYSLTAKETVRSVPDFASSVAIIDDTHIALRQPVLIDIGAVGKGYAVDLIAGFLDAQGLKRFLVDGSGDIFYRGDEPLRAGLEHPDDPTKVIGVLELTNCAFCASAGNRRKWDTFHHIIDPHTLTSPQNIIGTWVKAETTAIADAAATAIFLFDPYKLTEEIPFDFCILNSEYRVRTSSGFTAEFF